MCSIVLYCICANVTCVAIRLFLHSQLSYHTTWIWIPHGRDSAGRYVVTGSGPIRQHIGPIRLGVLGDFDWRTRLLVFASSSVPSPSIAAIHLGRSSTLLDRSSTPRKPSTYGESDQLISDWSVVPV